MGPRQRRTQGRRKAEGGGLEPSTAGQLRYVRSLVEQARAPCLAATPRPEPARGRDRRGPSVLAGTAGRVRMSTIYYHIHMRARARSFGCTG